MNSAKLKETIANIVKEESDYQEFFRKALEKSGKSITDMSDEEKKEFFNKIDAAWDGKGEKNEELVGNQKKLDVDGDGEIEASDLAALRAGETKEESVTESTINESPSSEEIRIAMLAVSKQKKYRRVTTSAAVNDLMNSLEVIARDIKNGKIKDESVNEDTKKRFEVDFYKVLGDRQTSHEEIIRGDKFSDVISQATKVAKSKGMNYVEFYYKDAFIGSIDKKSNYTFKKGRNSDKSPLSVNEGKKRFNTKYGVGKSKYVVNYHDGVKKHKDGSDFFDVQIFKNQKDLEAFKKALLQKGFVAESVNEAASRTAMEIGGLTGMNKDAVQKFVDDNNLDIEKVYQYVKVGKLPERMALVSAIAGRPGNSVQVKLIKKFK